MVDGVSGKRAMAEAANDRHVVSECPDRSRRLHLGEDFLLEGACAGRPTGNFYRLRGDDSPPPVGDLVGSGVWRSLVGSGFQSSQRRQYLCVLSPRYAIAGLPVMRESRGCIFEIPR